MRKANGVFSTRERKLAMWGLLTAAILATGGIAIDRLTGPSLGIYGQNFDTSAMPGVLDARPIG